jgi:ubiquinone/menaquinone biosynthesis C-methylase UbiE
MRKSEGKTAGSVVNPEMRAYYEARAHEYDDWWLGTGLFESRKRPGWTAEVKRLIRLLGALPPARTLDVACGTGFLTRHLPGAVTALDQSLVMVRLASARLPDAKVLEGDASALPFPDAAFDRAFMSHFYGHLLADERATVLGEAKRVAREVVIVDSARRPDRQAEEWQERELNDGSRHRVYKRFFTGDELAAEVGGSVLLDGDWFVAVRA